MRLMVAVILIQAIGAQSMQNFELKQFEAIRVNSNALGKLPESLRFIFADPVPDGERVNSVEEAAKRAGFGPVLISGKAAARIFVTNPANKEGKISVRVLTAAVRDANIENLTVPAEWDSVVIGLQQPRGILVDYGDFYFAQAAPSVLRAPAGFPLAQFMEVLFRVMGIGAAEARTLREQFAARPAAFFPIPPRYDMDIRQVPLQSGTGLLLQNADKGGELAFMWSTGNRSYFLTGLATEDQVISIARSLQ